MSTRTRVGGAVTLAAAGALALSACGSDNTSSSSSAPGSGGAPASGSIQCATGTGNASGSTAQKNAMQEWVKDYQGACSGTTINYQANGSSAGKTQFIQGQTAFAGSDSALKPNEQSAANARCQNNQALNLPMVGGPIALIYNLSGVDNLQLKGATIAKIFAGKITKWNDPEITGENPGVNLPSSGIQSVHRSDGSGTTDNFTKYLTAAGGSDWTYSNGTDWKAPAGQGSKGSDGVTQTVKSTSGAIGYVELSFATNANLNTVKVANGAGEYVAVSPEAVSKALDSATVTGSGNNLTLKLNYATNTPGAYPIFLVTYEIVCSKGQPDNQAALVKSFLTYTASASGQGVLSNLGYAPLGGSLGTKVQSAVGSLS